MLLLSEIWGQLHNLSVTAKFCKVIQKISAADGNFFTNSFQAKDIVDFGSAYLQLQTNGLLEQHLRR
jgi:hypothetical protein